MHVMGRIVFMGFGIALVGCLGGAPVFAAEKPTADGQKVMITSPKDGGKVSDSFELKYEITKDEQVGHVHVFVDNEYQRGFHGTFKGLSRGEHQITLKTTNKDHSTVTASHTIMVDVQWLCVQPSLSHQVWSAVTSRSMSRRSGDLSP